MNHLSFWGWAIKGLTGAVNLIVKLVEDNATLTEEMHDQLIEQAERLRDAVQQTSNRIENK